MIEIDQIYKIYRMGEVDVTALNGISLKINDGEMVAIIGASGSGKSTLMNVIGLLDQPSSGRYLLDNQDVSSYGDNALASLRGDKLGFVFQEFNLLPRASALANVELPLIYSGGANRRKRALEALERVGLGKRARHKPTELSGGEQQRVAIARALVNNPQVILADEPTGNLDSMVTKEIMRIFCDLHKDGITVILVTHEPDVAQQASRIIELRDGNIVRDEPTAGACAGGAA